MTSGENRRDGANAAQPPLGGGCDLAAGNDHRLLEDLRLRQVRRRHLEHQMYLLRSFLRFLNLQAHQMCLLHFHLFLSFQNNRHHLSRWLAYHMLELVQHLLRHNRFRS